MSSEPRYDVCVVGAGLLGLATAHALTAMLPGVSILVLDKESQIAAHQSSHNSGVVHSGLYYKPGSLKARLCVEGRDAVYEVCEAEGIPVERSGKLVIATEPGEIPALDELERRGRANGLVGLTRLGPDGIKDHEPAATGIDALYVPEAGVADFPALAAHLSERLRKAGAEVRLGREVTAIGHSIDGVDVTAGDDTYRTRSLVNCAGLHCDRVAALAGVSSPVKIIPFRGEYYELVEGRRDLVRGLIYPVPDPRFPFLGVHFTRTVDGMIEAGPNAVLALKREG
ncbi:MAG TPA: L-2-hydroxyglutarate oxidase, partial [Acidimicrobiia bacterium]